MKARFCTPFGSWTRAVTTTGWLAAGTAGVCVDLVNGGAGIGHRTAVAQSGGAEIGRHRQRAGRFEPVPIQAQQDLRPAVQPPRLEPQRRRLAGRQRLAFKATWQELSPVQMRSLQRMCREWLLA